MSCSVDARMCLTRVANRFSAGDSPNSCSAGDEVEDGDDDATGVVLSENYSRYPI